MGAIPKFAELEALSDEDLVARYDAAATNTVVGTGFYRDELFRRAQDRQAAAMVRFSEQVRNMTTVILGLTVVNVVLVAITIVT